MPDKVHVKKGDTVVVLSGKDRGSVGKILEVNPGKKVLIVEGVNIATKHSKPRGKYQQGGIIKQAAPIDSSNVMFLCSKCEKATKIGKRIMENGDKARICKKCGEIIDIINSKNE